MDNDADTAMDALETDEFPAGIAPGDHWVQIYDEYDALLDRLAAFVGDGLGRGEGVIAIATSPHLLGIEKRLQRLGLPLEEIRACEQYVALDAEVMLTRFMRKGWPNAHLFEACMLEVLDRARGPGRPVRAFGEMVSLLWAKGHAGATLRLEHLWQDLQARQSFSLYCAYPRIGFRDAQDSLQATCAAHTRAVTI
jgi:hypothetical protein